MRNTNQKIPSPQEDAELIRACREGRPGARDRLIEIYQPIVDRHVRQLCRQYGCTHLIPGHAAEIAQQVWAELFVRLDKMPQEHFAPAFAMLRRWRTVDYLRRELRYRNRHAHVEDAGAVADGPDPSPMCVHERMQRYAELRIEVRICLKGFPEKQGRFLQLYYFQGWTYKQIARSLGLEANTMGSLHARSLKRLKKAMQRRGSWPEEG